MLFFGLTLCNDERSSLGPREAVEGPRVHRINRPESLQTSPFFSSVFLLFVRILPVRPYAGELTAPRRCCRVFVDGDLLRNAATTAQGAGKNPPKTTHSTKLWRDLIGDDDFLVCFFAAAAAALLIFRYIRFRFFLLAWILIYDLISLSFLLLLHNGSDSSSSCDVMWLRRMFFILGFCISVRGTCQVAGNWVACDRTTIGDEAWNILKLHRKKECSSAKNPANYSHNSALCASADSSHRIALLFNFICQGDRRRRCATGICVVGEINNWKVYVNQRASLSSTPSA